MAEFIHEYGTVLLVIWAVPAAVLLLHHVYFVSLPLLVVKVYERTHPEWVRRYLERVVATPSLFGPTQKIVARIHLVGIYLPRGQHAEAAAHCRANLEALARARNPNRTAALESDIRGRLADCLEALGQSDEAAGERRRAAEAVARAPADTLRHLTLGKLRERENRHEEAYAAFRKALELTPELNTPVRIECMTHLVLSAFNAGRPRDCLRWAEEAIGLGAKGFYLRSAHRMAGVACGNLGQLEESESHFRRAYDLAVAQDGKPDMAEGLAQLADCLRKQGKLVEANEACIKAAALDPKGVRMACAVQSQIFWAWGRFDDALAALSRHNAAAPLVIPHYERRLLAAVALDAARIEAERGRADDAWGHVREALAEFRDDAKLGLKSEAVAAWVSAARGLADESLRLAIQLEPRLARFDRDPRTCRGVYFDLGMAACTRGDHPAGIDCWTRYLSLSPDPIDRPTAYYHRGECYNHLGRLTEARDDYQAAIAMNLDTHYTKLARRRLGGLVIL